MNNLEGKVALVTGGAKGIGKGIVEAFLAERMYVFATYLSSEESAEQMQVEHDNLHCWQADVRDFDVAKGIIDSIASIRSTYGCLDVLVNNAGIAQVMELDDPNYFEALAESWAVNCTGVENYTNIALSYMQKFGHGDIFNLSSVAAQIYAQVKDAPENQHPPFSMHPYVNTKVRNEVFTKETTTQLALTGQTDVRCRVLHPQLVKTGLGLYLATEFAKMASEKTGQEITPEIMTEQMRDMTTSKKIWTPEEIGPQFVYLLKHPEVKTIDQKLWADGEYMKG